LGNGRIYLKLHAVFGKKLFTAVFGYFWKKFISKFDINVDALLGVGLVNLEGLLLFVQISQLRWKKQKLKNFCIKNLLGLGFYFMPAC
jgi:hypothetical protein